MSKEKAAAQIEKSCEELAEYYHSACETMTSVDPSVIKTMALDPYYFPNRETDCAGCGAAATTEVVLSDERTLSDAFKEMRRTVTPLGKIVRFVVIPLLPAMIVATIVLINAPKIQTFKDGLSLFSIVTAMVGFLTFPFVTRLFFKPLRQAGFFWN